MLHTPRSSGVTIGPADPALQGAPFLGAPKFHLSDGRRTKNIGGAKNVQGRQKRGKQKKRSPRKMGVYKSPVGGAKWTRGGAKFPSAGGRPWSTSRYCLEEVSDSEIVPMV